MTFELPTSRLHKSQCRLTLVGVYEFILFGYYEIIFTMYDPHSRLMYVSDRASWSFLNDTHGDPCPIFEPIHLQILQLNDPC